MLHLCRNEDYRSVSDNTECEREGTFLQNLTMFKLFDFKIKTCDTLKHTKIRSTEQSVLRRKEKWDKKNHLKLVI